MVVHYLEIDDEELTTGCRRPELLHKAKHTATLRSSAVTCRECKKGAVKRAQDEKRRAEDYLSVPVVLKDLKRIATGGPVIGVVIVHSLALEIVASELVHYLASRGVPIEHRQLTTQEYAACGYEPSPTSACWLLEVNGIVMSVHNAH